MISNITYFRTSEWSADHEHALGACAHVCVMDYVHNDSSSLALVALDPKAAFIFAAASDFPGVAAAEP
jgi:hypothetical protein